MIGKVGSRRNGNFLKKHFSDLTHNLSATILYVCGLTPAPHGPMKEELGFYVDQLGALGAGAIIKDIMHVGSLRGLKSDRPVTKSEKVEMVKMCLTAQGLENQPFIIIEHHLPSDGDAADWHLHYVASRVKDGCPISDSFDWRKMNEATDRIEEHFGLTKTQKNRSFKNASGYSLKPYELQNGYQTGIDPRWVRGRATCLAEENKVGSAFQAALPRLKWVLAVGERANKAGELPLFIIDAAGGRHLLQARIDDMTKSDFAKFTSSIDRSGLSTLNEAVAQQVAKMVLPDQAWLQEAWRGETSPDEIVRQGKARGITFARGVKPNIYFAVQARKWTNLHKLTGLTKDRFVERVAGMQRLGLLRLADVLRSPKPAQVPAQKQDALSAKSKGLPLSQVVMTKVAKPPSARDPAAETKPVSEERSQHMSGMSNGRKLGSSTMPERTSERGNSGIDALLRDWLVNIKADHISDCDTANDALRRVADNPNSTEAERAQARHIHELSIDAADIRWRSRSNDAEDRASDLKAFCLDEREMLEAFAEYMNDQRREQQLEAERADRALSMSLLSAGQTNSPSQNHSSARPFKPGMGY